MKLYNLLSKLMVSFGITAVIATYGSAACEGGAATGTWTTDILSYDSGTQTAKGTGSNSDNYIINANQNGSLVIAINNTDNNENLTAYVYSGNQCAGAALGTITVDNGNSGNLIVNSIVAGQSYSLWITGSSISNNTDYNLNIALSNPRNFEIIHQSNLIGNMKMFGNLNLCQNNGSGSCSATVDTALSNNGINTLFHKLASDNSDAGITNSSSYTFAFPAGVTKADVVWAGLYWQAGIKGKPTSTQIANAQKVRLKAPGDTSYRDITAETNNGTHINRFNWLVNPNVSTSALAWYYQGIRDITSIIQDTGAGTYQVANIEATYGPHYDSGDFAGWAIVLVYRDSADTFKNVTIYDGFGAVNNAGSSVDTNLTGFLTPSTNPVNSKFMIFGSEGDVTFTADKISLTSGSLTGTEYFLKSDGTATSTSGFYNPMNSSITMTGADTRVPNYANAIGIDIDTYNVGSGGSGIITTDQNATRIRLTTTNDIFNPGVFAFSTDLYQPNMCYEETLFNSVGTNISGVGVQVNKDDILKVRVTVKNNGTETAKGVQVLHTFDNVKFPYKTGTTSYDNFNSSFARIQVSPASDSSGNDLFDYDGTSLGKIRLGEDANSTDGGEFITYSSNDQAYAVYEYNATVKQFDQNFSNEYYAAYKSTVDGLLDYSNNPVKMELCSGTRNSFWGYSLIPTPSNADIVNNFNLINYNNGIKAITTKVAGHTSTSITGVHLNTSGQASTFTSANNLRFLIIPYLSNSTCTTQETIYDTAGNTVVFSLSNGLDHLDMNIKIPAKAVKDARFKITSLDLEKIYTETGETCLLNSSTTGNLQGIGQCVNDALGHYTTNFGSSAYNRCQIGNGQPCNSNNHGKSCNGDTTCPGYNPLYDNDYGCLMCTLDQDATCSSDNFAIRPEKFVITNTSSTDWPNLLHAAQDYNVTINAYNYSSINASQDYNQTRSNIDLNQTLILKNGISAAVGQMNGTLVWGGSDFNMSNGISNLAGNHEVAGIIFGDVGKVTVRPVDDNWAAVDINNYPIDTTPHDCSANGAYLCGDKNVTFIPDSFDFNELNITNNNGNPGSFTYIANEVNQMGGRIHTQIRALNKNGVVTQNFATFPLWENSMNVSPEVTSGIYLYPDANETMITNLELGFTAGLKTILWNETNTSQYLRFNFQRDVNPSTPPSPFDVNGSDLNIVAASTYTDPEDGDNAFINGSRNGTADGSSRFVYGRIIPRDVRVFGANTPFTANGWYEVYNAPMIGTAPLPMSKNGVLWYTNTLHTDLSDGDGNVTLVVTGANPVNTNIVPGTGVEVYSFDNSYGLGGYKAHILTAPWLWYGINASAYANPGTDCLTHPCFNISVVPAIGATGSAKSTNESTKESKRSTKGTGWHSTTDYAPAIR